MPVAFLALLLLDAFTGWYGDQSINAVQVTFSGILAILFGIGALYIDIATARPNARRLGALISVYAYSGDVSFLREAVVKRIGHRRILRGWMRLPGEERYVLVCSTVIFGVLLRCYVVIKLNKLGQCRVAEVLYQAMLPNWEVWIHSRRHKRRSRVLPSRKPRRINPAYPSMIPGLSAAIKRAEEDSWSRDLARDTEEEKNALKDEE